MVMKFQIKPTLLLFFAMINHASSNALTVNMNENLLISEKRAVEFVSGHNESRCSAYIQAPGEIESYKEPNEAISGFLSDKKRVNLKAHASKETKEAIITISIGEKITHFKSGANYLLKDKLNENNLLTLDRTDPYYGHFRALSLIDDITEQLTDCVFANNFNIDTAITNISRDLFIEIERLSNITVDMFKACFENAYGKHKIGIDKHVEKLKIKITIDPIILHDVSISNSIAPLVVESDDVVTAGQNSLLIGSLSTVSNGLVGDGSIVSEEIAAAKKLEIPTFSSNVVVTSLVSTNKSLKVDGSANAGSKGGVPKLGEESPLADSSRNNNGNNKSQLLVQPIVFVPITTEDGVKTALAETKKKKDAYKSEKGILKTKNADTESDKELVLLDAYRKLLKEFNKVTNNSFDQINAAKKAYEEYMQTKSVTESAGAGNAKAPLTKKKSFYMMLAGTN